MGRVYGHLVRTTLVPPRDQARTRTEGAERERAFSRLRRRGATRDHADRGQHGGRPMQVSKLAGNAHRGANGWRRRDDQPGHGLHQPRGDIQLAEDQQRRAAQVSRRRSAPPARSSDQPELPLAVTPKTPRKRLSTVLEPAVAARLAVARRAKPSSVPHHLRLIPKLELRPEHAENYRAPRS